ncbi:hypothetical protein NKJ88_01325 [Mesorhizobium sp. M0016]|uniref:hypothetical protein n=1 Tax=Mesorhizobium sp. M0016 TaxID=2956843 RepID=UPI003339B9EA
MTAGFLTSLLGEASEIRLPHQNDPNDLRAIDPRNVLSNEPLNLYMFLGKHFSSVLPGTTWNQLPVAEEYKNDSIRYATIDGLREYTKNWKFADRDFCVSNYSLFVIFFNRGYVFKVELRFVSDDFLGDSENDTKQYCFDEKPLFDVLHNETGGSLVAKDGGNEVIERTNKYVRILTTDFHSADLSWALLGAPGAGAP